ncbi:MAG: Response regulator of zinc sigma-54-dependent two-component system [Firmicutes bacterium]|nr:Response regulator of zinc sigma-54-dependent two-component system [Bacillota bacterium]
MVITEDRVGMALDLLKVVSSLNLNISAMEVSPGVGYLKIDMCEKETMEELIDRIENLDGVSETRFIELLPFEERERQIRAVIDSVDEGIVAIDKNGTITIFNHSAERIFNLDEDEVLGKPAAEILAGDIPILRSIKTGQCYDNEEIILRTNRGTSHYITTGRPIMNEKEHIVGAVASIKDINKVIELVYSMTSPPSITFSDILGISESITYAKNIAKMVATSNSTVLIRGESGTGKELFARSIHMSSSRKDKPFVPVNCGALPDTLLESELFGYEEGAFTGARKGGKQGLFRFAHGGTLFLDEIGELSPQLQVKLLRVLQGGKVRRVGGTEEISVDVRVIAATNNNLEEMMKEGLFREDLYYRLNVVPLFIPPLRDRKEDILILVENFIEQVGKNMGKPIKGITRQAMERLMEYHWPGNVRELSNVIERGINLVEGSYIEERHIILDTRYMESSYETGSSWYGENLKDILEETEKRVLSHAVEKLGSSRKIGKALGLSHTAVIKKLRKYNLEK